MPRSSGSSELWRPTAPRCIKVPDFGGMKKFLGSVALLRKSEDRMNGFNPIWTAISEMSSLSEIDRDVFHMYAKSTALNSVMFTRRPFRAWPSALGR